MRQAAVHLLIVKTVLDTKQIKTAAMHCQYMTFHFVFAKFNVLLPIHSI